MYQGRAETFKGNEAAFEVFLQVQEAFSPHHRLIGAITIAEYTYILLAASACTEGYVMIDGPIWQCTP